MAQERDIQRLTDGGTHPLVIGMGMREDVFRDVVILQVSE